MAGRLTAQALVEGAIDIALDAGAAIMRVYEAGPVSVSSKPDASPLTEADLSAHRAIVAGLHALTPDIPILSEEGAQIPFAERSRWDRYWLVDPLDGTKEFLSRNGEFTVNIALIDAHTPVLGVVYAPAKDVLYYSPGPDGGAFRRTRTGEPERVAVRATAESPVRVVGSRSHRGDSLTAALERLGAHTLLTIGSSLKICLVAEGRADWYPRLGPTSEWDTAAAHAVVLAAGGEVVDATGAPLEYNRKASLLNPHVLVYGDCRRDWVGLVRGV